MHRIKNIMIIIFLTVLLIGCNKKTEDQKLKWNEKDFSNIGIKDLKKLDNFSLNTYVSDDNSVSLTMKCNSNCKYESINTYLNKLYDKVKQISNDNIYKVKTADDFTYDIDQKITSFDETKGIQSEGFFESQYIYKYNDNNYIVYISANIKEIILSINKIN